MNMEQHKERSHYNNLDLTGVEKTEITRFLDGWFINESATQNPQEGIKDLRFAWLSILDRLSTKENIGSAKYVINNVNNAFFEQLDYLNDLSCEDEEF